MYAIGPRCVLARFHCVGEMEVGGVPHWFDSTTADTISKADFYHLQDGSHHAITLLSNASISVPRPMPRVEIVGDLPIHEIVPRI
jgi:hypothetical protein